MDGFLASSGVFRRASAIAGSAVLEEVASQTPLESVCEKASGTVATDAGGKPVMLVSAPAVWVMDTHSSHPGCPNTNAARRIEERSRVCFFILWLYKRS